MFTPNPIQLPKPGRNILPIIPSPVARLHMGFLGSPAIHLPGFILNHFSPVARLHMGFLGSPAIHLPGFILNHFRHRIHYYMYCVC